MPPGPATSGVRGAVAGVAERAWFAACLALGRLLRSVRYSRVRVIARDGVREVHKRRAAFAPLLVALGDALMRMLDTGVRVLPQRAWVERERDLYATLHGASVRVEGDGTLVLPCLAGATLASLLEDPALERSVRRRAVALAAAALAALHREGITHGDAMAENVMVDVAGGAAHWFDWETVHAPSRPAAWRRADDVRALLATCLLRFPDDELDETMRLILHTYADDEVARRVAAGFGSVARRSHVLHLGQAALPWSRFTRAGRALDAVTSDPHPAA